MDQNLKMHAANNVVHVTIPSSVAFNLEKIQQIQKNVLGRLGCQACCSGFDIRFIQEMDFKFNEKAELVQGI